MGNLEIKMNKSIFFFVFLFLLTNYCVSQSDNYLSQKVKEFQNKKQQGFLFYNKNTQGETATGNILVFDETGMMIIHQFDMNLIYFFNKDFSSTESILELEPPVQAGLTSAVNDLLFFTIGDDVTYMHYKGEILFRLNPYAIVKGLMFSSFFYHANILFFVDDDYKLYSILSPSMDQEKNAANYRNPEQTKKLFAQGSGVDLQGLTMDDKGQLSLNGIPFNIRLQYFGKYGYYILDQNNVSLWDGHTQTMVSTKTASENEIGESTAIHPSGDIYFLKYNKTTDKHILYRIENTWDPAFRFKWYWNASLLQ